MRKIDISSRFVKMNCRAVRRALRSSADPAKAKILQRFFKTGKGEYGEGDVFMGVMVPVIRKWVQQFGDLELKEVQPLLQSDIHEERLFALLILVWKFKKGEEMERKRIFDFYCRHRRWINNWDLVDLSAPHIVGVHLLDRDQSILWKMASSSRLWDRRIAVLSTFTFIRHGRYAETFRLARQLLGDEHDLMHKAIGWMLREIGKRDQEAEVDFLKVHYQKMPRTMLRYAIEKFPLARRKAYLLGKV